METTQNDFVESQKRKKKRKRIRNLILAGVAVLLLVAGGTLLSQYANAQSENVSLLNYVVGAVSEGEIASVISGSGTLAAKRTESFTAPADATVETVLVQAGDAVSEGDVVMTLSSDSVQEELDACNDELDTLRADMADMTQTRSSLSVTATAKGVVKDIRVSEGDAVEDVPYLCLLSTDGKMKLTIPAPDGMRTYDTVFVSVDGVQYEGLVREIANGAATIVISKNSFSIGTPAQVTNEAGNILGTGTLDVNEFIYVTARAGRIAKVGVTENQSVAQGKALFALAKGAPSDKYLDAKAQEADLLEQIAELTASTVITAPFDALVTTLSVSPGDEVDAGASLCALSGTDGLTMTLSIDELDIASVKHGQSASVTLDALEGSYDGEVSNISYSGSGSYVTSYTATVAVEPIEGAYPGMSASVEITTETSGTSLLVLADALQYDGSQAYLYLADADAAIGQSVPESEMDLSALQKVNVETGMADGSYVVVVSDALKAGDLIWVPKRTTTASYTADENTVTSFSSMGGMGGGSMPSGDFSGGPSGSFSGGNMPSGDSSDRRQRPGS